MTDLFKIAVAELGTKEVPGDAHSPEVLKYAQEAGFNSITDDETPWCSIFMNWCCMKAELQRTNKANARSWLSVGRDTDDPSPGDVVVFWRESPDSWKGHVGIFVGFSRSRTRVFTLGGNQKNMVSIQPYDAAKVLAFKSLSPETNLDIPKPTLKIGSRGVEVIKLQHTLNELGYPVGAADGMFGPRTEKMLKKMQAKEQITVDGIYGKQAQALIENIFQR